MTDITTNSARDEIVAYLSRFVPVDRITDDEDMFARGFVSSMFAMQLVAFIEQSFDVEVENEDLELDNFRSIAALTAFVERKQDAGTP